MSPATYIRWFSELRLTDRPTVGGKCASLGELMSAGIDVPDGFAITVQAYEDAGDLGGLREQLRHIVLGVDPARSAELTAAREQATALLRSAELPIGLEGQVRQAYRSLCERYAANRLPVAVRSSAVAEDGDSASFAGQQETYLWVHGADGVIEHLRECWASLYTAQAIAYRHRLPPDQAQDASRISVAVQAMVEPCVSGVAFTVSPRTGDRSVVAINASWGLGQAVVSGEVTPDEFWLSKIGPTLVQQRVALKSLRCVPAAHGKGVTNEPVPIELRDVPCLTTAQAVALCALAIRVEDHYGAPQDIEWAMLESSDDAPRFVLLQSRPETMWKQRQAQAKATFKAAGYLAMIQAAARATEA